MWKKVGVGELKVFDLRVSNQPGFRFSLIGLVSFFHIVFSKLRMLGFGIDVFLVASLLMRYNVDLQTHVGKLCFVT